MGLITIIKILDCPLIILSSAELPMNLGNIERMSLREKEIFGNAENQTRGWEARMLPLCYATPSLTTLFPTFSGSWAESDIEDENTKGEYFECN